MIAVNQSKILLKNFGTKIIQVKVRLKYLSLTIFIILLIFTGCKKLNQLTIFNLKYDTQTTIKSVVGINLPFNLVTPDIKTNSESSFEINNTHKDLIQEVSLKSLTLSISNPVDGDFSFLKSIKIYIKGDGIDEKLVAWKDADNTFNENSIELETSSDDLQQYIKKDSITLKITVVTKKLLLTDYDIDIHSVFKVDAKILGI